MKSILSSTIASIRDLNFLKGQMTTFLFMSAITPEILEGVQDVRRVFTDLSPNYAPHELI
jgi:hypothetical protein